ncbi:MAG: hypothetical protein C4346_02690 [Chloroflexota bacterium]
MVGFRRCVGESAFAEGGPVSTHDPLEQLYAEQEDPWDYTRDPYEHAKYEATLASLPQARYATGLEIGCSEGVFTRMAAGRVDHLLGVDVSATAIARAHDRCADLPGVSFRVLDFIREDLTERFDVIFCSEVLYYIPPWQRTRVARKIASWLKPGGDLVLVHTWQEYTRTWDDIFGEGGAERLHRLFTHVVGLPVIDEHATDDYEILVVRSAPPVVPSWLRLVERVRLGLLAALPTARRVARNRMRASPLAQRLLSRIGVARSEDAS